MYQHWKWQWNQIQVISLNTLQVYLQKKGLLNYILLPAIKNVPRKFREFSPRSPIRGKRPGQFKDYPGSLGSAWAFVRTLRRSGALPFFWFSHQKQRHFTVKNYLIIWTDNNGCDNKMKCLPTWEMMISKEKKFQTWIQFSITLDLYRFSQSDY